MRSTLLAVAALLAQGQPLYAQDTSQKTSPNADIGAPMDVGGKAADSKPDEKAKSDARTAAAEASRHLARRPGANGGGMNSHAGDNNGRGQDELDPIRGSMVGQP